MPQNAKANLSALIESTEDLIWSVDLDHRFIAFNNAMRQDIEANYGHRPEVGMILEDMLPPGRAVLLSQLYERALTEGHFRIEYPLTDGRILEMAFNPIKVDGNPTGVSVFGKNITACKHAEQALAEGELRFRRIFTENGSVMLLVEPDSGEIVDANPAASTYYGYARKQLVGMSIGQINILPPEEVALERQRSVREERNRFNFCHRLACGEVRDVEVYSSPIHVKGRPLLFSIVHDITERKQAEDQLRDSEERFRKTFEQAPVGMVHLSFEGLFLRCNARFAEIVGYAPEEVVGLTHTEITPPEDHAQGAALLQEMAAGTTSIATVERRLIRKNGSLTWVKVTTSVQRDGKGNAAHIVTFVEDINARKTAEKGLAAIQEALRASEERYRTAFQTSLDAININRLDNGKYVEVNQAFLSIMGFERDEVIGRTSLDLGIWVNLHDRQNLIEALRQHSSCRDLKAPFRKKNGATFWGLMSASIIKVDDVPCILSVARDISDAKAAEDEIRTLAFYDPLTGLPNRRLLLDRLGQAMATSSRDRHRRALLFVDLDDFKTLNDTLGHQTGDLLLQEVAQRLGGCVRETDTVARLGGDEFLVMLEDLSETAEEAAAQAKCVGEKILAAIGQPYLLSGHECFSTCSVGITVFGVQLEGVNELLQQADIAMYQAKAAGRNAIRFFAPALQAAVNTRASLGEDLRRALKKNQLMLYYQPQMDRDVLVGAEALIRWNHPKRGILQPSEFIALAEETGLILPMGTWVLETACKQIAEWSLRKETAHISLAVNISARQFRQADFVKQVLAALSRSGANPCNLKLELTESILLDNIEEVIVKMTELKAHGVGISLDDFGTGYSSLTYLKRLPLDQLKIDRSFVRDIMEDASSGAIAQTIITLCNAMGLSVIAEGVEEEEQRDFLTQLGCHSFQGYFYSKPLPLHEFHALWPDGYQDASSLPASTGRKLPASASMANALPR
jgi:diguanylate cyclase (GGDEF)-like protein/PAS domain S-box-containing protein